MVPRAHGETYAAGLPDARPLAVVKGAGHAAPLQQPQATAEVVLRFLQETETSDAKRPKQINKI